MKRRKPLVRVVVLLLALSFTGCEPVEERLAPDPALVNEAQLRLRLRDSELEVGATAELLPGSTIDVVYDPAERIVTIADAAILASDLTFDFGFIGICATDIRLELAANPGDLPSAEVAPLTGRLKQQLFVPVRATMEIGLALGGGACDELISSIDSFEDVRLDGRMDYAPADGSFLLSLDGAFGPLVVVIGGGQFVLEIEVGGELTLNFDNSLLPPA